jgi:hypothetical protein
LSVAHSARGGALISSASATNFRLSWNRFMPASASSAAAANGQKKGTLCSCAGVWGEARRVRAFESSSW